MSLEGGLEELVEFFWTWASLASKAAIRRSKAAQFAHGLSAGTTIVPASYPIKPETTKISLGKVRERLRDFFARNTASHGRRRRRNGSSRWVDFRTGSGRPRRGNAGALSTRAAG